MSSLRIVVGMYNTFEWWIESYTKFRKHFSEIILVDGYPCEIHADRNIYGKTKDLWQFSLHTENSSIFPVSYRFSIVDSEGQDYVTSSGKVVQYGSEQDRMLMIIENFYLTRYNLIKCNDTLIVRFTLHSKLDARGGPNSSKVNAHNVADGATKSFVTNDSCTNTDEEPDNLLETLSKDFSTFYESKTDTDCVLRVSEAKFPVHRAVLSARSSVFSAMFHHDTAEKRSGEVNIPDVDPTSFSDLLYYVYSGKIRRLTADTATSIYTAADKYDLLELRKKCLEFLKQNLTMENFCEAAVLAHTHGEMELEERVLCFIGDNLDEVLESNSWQQFLKDKTLLASKLLTSALKAAKKQIEAITSK